MKHEIIYTEEYALIVSDEKPIEEQYFLFEPYSLVFKADSTEYGEDAINTHGVEYVESFTDDRQFNVRYCKTVIGHRPLKDAPVLEGVSLLPEFSKEEDDVEKVAKKEYPSTNTHLDRLDEADGNAYYRSIFKKGYNKAKETYKYTEKDLAEAYERGMNNIDSDGCHIDQPADDFTEFIQSLQQPKRPKSILLETIYRVKSGTIQEHKDGLAGFEYYEPKTITNSQNQTELVGEYIYE